MTNSPPDIHILDDDAVGEIEKRIDSFPLSPLQARALCQTVRALKADIATMQSGFDAYSQRIGVEKADLQSQLEQVTKERDEEKRLRAELKQIANAGFDDISSLGTTLKENAVIDFRSRAIALCRDKAAGWRGSWKEDAANEIASELEQLK